MRGGNGRWCLETPRQIGRARQEPGRVLGALVEEPPDGLAVFYFELQRLAAAGEFQADDADVVHRLSMLFMRSAQRCGLGLSLGCSAQSSVEFYQSRRAQLSEFALWFCSLSGTSFENCKRSKTS